MEWGQAGEDIIKTILSLMTENQSANHVKTTNSLKALKSLAAQSITWDLSPKSTQWTMILPIYKLTKEIQLSGTNLKSWMTQCTKQILNRLWRAISKCWNLSKSWIKLKTPSLPSHIKSKKISWAVNSSTDTRATNMRLRCKLTNIWTKLLNLSQRCI